MPKHRLRRRASCAGLAEKIRPTVAFCGELSVAVFLLRNDADVLFAYRLLYLIFGGIDRYEKADF